ncbi:MAG: cupin domain-containing protein [Gammaproteobacteria bacterium]|nr:cupin domain-containing protein [Gammaproteobacteria bacterium]NND54544.1 cupin domain-containing protein [Gammaproteobacteria bacterium]
MKKVNINTATWREATHGDKFQRGHISLTDMNDNHELGCSAFCVAPGKRAFPKHAHLANDEALFIVSGSGALTIGDETDTVIAGDFIMLPKGEQHAHVLVNDSDNDLIYLCMSTMIMPEVVHYPDSGKLGVLGSKDFWQSGDAGVSGFYKPNPVGYWDGED